MKWTCKGCGSLTGDPENPATHAPWCPNMQLLRALPNTPEWQGKPQEAKALRLRILTHLTRQAAEAGAAIPFRALDARDLGRAICLLQHCFHGQFPCMVCRSWIGSRLISQLEEKALSLATDEHR